MEDCAYLARRSVRKKGDNRAASARGLRESDRRRLDRASNSFTLLSVCCSIFLLLYANNLRCYFHLRQIYRIVSSMGYWQSKVFFSFLREK